jgi:hypothetical protein
MAERLNMTQFREALMERGVVMSVGALSRWVNEGEGDLKIETQLKGVRESNKLLMPVEAVDSMAAFLPRFKALKMQLVQAPGLLQKFLTDGAEALDSYTHGLTVLPETEIAISAPDAPVPYPRPGVVVGVTREPPDAVNISEALLKAIAEVMAERTSHRLLNERQVCEKIGQKTTNAVYNLRVMVGGRNMWRESDLDRFIADLPFAYTKMVTGNGALWGAQEAGKVGRYVFLLRTNDPTMLVQVVNDQNDMLAAYVVVGLQVDFADPALRINTFPHPRLMTTRRKWLLAAREAAHRKNLTIRSITVGVFRNWEGLSAKEQAEIEKDIGQVRENLNVPD